MPKIDAFLFDKKGSKKNLVLILDEDDGVIECIKQGMLEHKLELVKVESIEGSIKEAVINFFECGHFKSAVIKNKVLLKVSGNFKLNYGELFGQMKIVTDERPPIHGTLVRAKANQDLKLTLSFIELEEKEDCGI